MRYQLRRYDRFGQNRQPIRHIMDKAPGERKQQPTRKKSECPRFKNTNVKQTITSQSVWLEPGQGSSQFLMLRRATTFCVGTVIS